MDDILYLGRGVSGQLHERSGDPQLLRWHRLPELCTPQELAAALELPLPRLRWLAYHSERVTRPHYTCRMIPRRGGGERMLSIPRSGLRRVQTWIRTEILDRVAAEDPAQGFVKGRNVLTNALPHSGQWLVIRMDLADFFPSIGFGRVRAVFRSVGYSPAAASILALLCTECPRVPEGGGCGEQRDRAVCHRGPVQVPHCQIWCAGILTGGCEAWLRVCICAIRAMPMT